MKIIGVIPARYASTRFPGKPLADICGKPMIWWVYQQAKKVKEFSEVYIATDDIKITNELDKLDIPYVMTKDNHKSVFERIQEFSDYITADYYVIINGDEPLINPVHIASVIPQNINQDIITNTIAKISSPSEVNDIANIKVVFDENKVAKYMSRQAIPFPNKCLDFDYYKHVGITGITKKMLDFYVSHKSGQFERIEGIDHLRFIDYDKNMQFIVIENAQTLSVDTPKDLEKVRKSIAEKIERGEISLCQ